MLYFCRKRAESADPNRSGAQADSGQCEDLATSFRISPYSTTRPTVAALLRDKDFSKQNFFLNSAKSCTNIRTEPDSGSEQKTEPNKSSCRGTEPNKTGSLKTEPNKSSCRGTEPNKTGSLKSEAKKSSGVSTEAEKTSSLKTDHSKVDHKPKSQRKSTSKPEEQEWSSSRPEEPKGRKPRGRRPAEPSAVLTYSNKKVFKSSECIDELVDQDEGLKGWHAFVKNNNIFRCKYKNYCIC